MGRNDAPLECVISQVGFVQQMRHFPFDLGNPVNEVEDVEADDGELEDPIEMNEPEIENEQNEAFGDDMSEYEQDGENDDNDENDEEDSEDSK